MAIKQQEIVFTVTNSFQNSGQQDYSQANMCGNLSMENPTVEQLNAAMTCGRISNGQVDAAEPAFGAHLKEAVDTVRRIFR